MSQQAFRLGSGGEIDRGRPIHFRCNGREWIGYHGDTLASALLANGVRLVGRSFKFHRPRGILTAGCEEPNALFRVNVDGHVSTLVRATQQPLVEGLVAVSENCWPGVHFDFGRGLDFAHRLLPAGFYHKTFKWPSWAFYEWAVRAAAGIGRLTPSPKAKSYFKCNAHCEVLVVGGGRSGLEAALGAAAGGERRVILVEQDEGLGGRGLCRIAEAEGGSRARMEGLRGDRESRERVGRLKGERESREHLERLKGQLASCQNVRIMTRTTAAALYPNGVLTAHEHSGTACERFWTIRTREVILCTGAIEQPLVFENNDLPGVMLAGAAHAYVTRFAVAPGRRGVVATNDDGAYRVAFDLHRCGVQIVSIVDSRGEVSSELHAEAVRAGIEVRLGAVIRRANGNLRLRSVVVEAVGRGRETLACDLLAMSGGWNPTLHLLSQAGGTVRYDEGSGGLVPDRVPGWIRVAGRAAGIALKESAAPLESRSLSVPRGRAGRQWVDFQYDVTVADVELAAREGFDAVEHMKRFTTAGMSIDQGKTGNSNALRLLAAATGRTAAEVGTTTFRPPYMPVTLGAIAGGREGARYATTRRLPARAWHAQHGAQWELYGEWSRPACYPRADETRAQAIHREVLTVRRGVGLFDGSPLGKIEVRGPDAAEFLNRIYANEVLRLKEGRVRYAIMLNENGVIMDDGVLARLGPDHYLVGTSSSAVPRIARWLEMWHQCVWPDMRVAMLPVTTQWAVLTLSGPHARRVLQRCPLEMDVNGSAFPHMAVRTGKIFGIAARVQRVSYTGELSFEIAVPATSATDICGRLMVAGAAEQIAPVGSEALMTLRLEKGFLHVGADTDATTNPFDVGLGRMIAARTVEFIGRRSLQREADRSAGRRQLVGLEPAPGEGSLAVGDHIRGTRSGLSRSEGFVTSAQFSPTLSKWVGLGLVERGTSRYGEVVPVRGAGRESLARIVPSRFYDVSGERMHA